MNASPRRMKKYVQYYWNEHLQKHFQEEENILFITGDPYCEKAKQEHRRIEQLISDINANDTDPELFRVLAILVDDHIRYEERELFPYLEKTIAAKQLTDVGAQLKQLHPEGPADDYEDAFWNR